MYTHSYHIDSENTSSTNPVNTQLREADLERSAPKLISERYLNSVHRGGGGSLGKQPKLNQLPSVNMRTPLSNRMGERGKGRWCLVTEPCGLPCSCTPWASRDLGRPLSTYLPVCVRTHTALGLPVSYCTVTDFTRGVQAHVGPHATRSVCRPPALSSCKSLFLFGFYCYYEWRLPCDGCNGSIRASIQSVCYISTPGESLSPRLTWRPRSF